MYRYKRIVEFVLFLLIACLSFVSCSEKKEGKVIITEQEFSIRQDAEFNWVIDAKGKIRNVGEVDVKKVVVTAYCRSCTEVLVAGSWYINDVPKTIERDQLDTISYLTAGDEEAFSFKEVAFFFQQSGKSPEGMPDNLEVVIESFEVVEE